MNDLGFLKHLSHSNLSLFHECRRCWFLRYKYEYESPASEAMELGSKVHKCVENYHKGIEQDLTVKLPHKKWEYTLKSFLSPYSEYYLNNHHNGVEIFIEASIDRANGEIKSLPIPIVGYIDRIWNKVPHDLKTSARRYNDSVLESRQHGIYTYLVYKEFGYIPKKFIYDVLIKNKTPKVQIVDIPLNEDLMNDTVDFIFDTWEEMLVAEMPESHSWGCWNESIMP